MNFTKMNNTLNFKGFLTGLFVVALGCTTFAQVKFKLTMLPDGETYQVSMIPEKTWEHPYNITSTAQVTVKVPTNSFEVTDLTSLQLDTEWQDNSRSDAPEEAPEIDYISFGLVSLGTLKLDYKVGKEIPLFSFKNALPCQGSVALMDNTNDPFMAPNSRRANVGNSIAIFGARGDAYAGNVIESSEIPCQADLSTSIESVDKIQTEELNVYPNPALNEVFVDMSWNNGQAAGDLVIMDATGKEVKKQPVTLNDGFNKIQLNIDQLIFGIYSIEVQLDGQSIYLDRFVKGN